MGAFLDLLKVNIRAGRQVQVLPDDLAHAMLAATGRTVDLNDPIEGDVAL
jgi:antitoxin PrlF